MGLRTVTTTIAPASSSGFVRVTKPLTRRRLMICSKSMQKQGKSHFALTAPPPIYYLDLDNGLEGVIDKFADKKEIHVSEFYSSLVLPDDIASREGNDYFTGVAEYCDGVWERYKAEFKIGLRNGRTLVIDTYDEAWELLRLARFGKLDQIMPHRYGPVNREFKSLFDEASSSGINLIMLHKMKDEYINDKPTGRQKRAGNKNAEYDAQHVIRHMRAGSEFSIEIEDCRIDPSLNGMVLPNDFATLASVVFPDEPTETWL